MSTAHEDQALAAAYVLGALDAAERRQFEAHLGTCSICREEVRGLGMVADALAFAVPPVTPPAELRSRVLSAITGSTPEAPLPIRKRRSSDVVRRWLPVAAALILAVSAGAYSWQLRSRVSMLEDRLDDAERRASASDRAAADARRAADQAQALTAVLSAPDLVRIDLSGQPPAALATARALWSRTRGMVFTTSGLPLAPAGRAYQVWIVTPTAPVSAGLITPDPSGRATVFFDTPPDVAPPVAIAVTLEPAGGVRAPTGDKYLVGTPL